MGGAIGTNGEEKFIQGFFLGGGGTEGTEPRGRPKLGWKIIY